MTRSREFLSVLELVCRHSFTDHEDCIVQRIVIGPEWSLIYRRSTQNFINSYRKSEERTLESLQVPDSCARMSFSCSFPPSFTSLLLSQTSNDFNKFNMMRRSLVCIAVFNQLMSFINVQKIISNVHCIQKSRINLWDDFIMKQNIEWRSTLVSLSRSRFQYTSTRSLVLKTEKWKSYFLLNF